MVIPSLIRRKRDGGALAAPEWAALVGDYAAGRVPDYQMAALLMAIFFRGLAPEELAALTDSMIASGERLRFEGLDVPVVDKHSTGGVGDKVSLVLAPLAASCGVAVPTMAGRGLGHTGGTLDKLEAIPGFRTTLGLREAEAQVRRLGCAMFGQTAEIAPADRRLYALRDVTGTVESIPLLASSIMSKKLAEGLDALVLDVKTGSGAFLPELGAALELARTMVAIGEARGCRTVALLTAMDRPLGHACGNALEVEEAIAALRGEGPADLLEVTYALGSEMLTLAGAAASATDARLRLDEALRSGRALETFARVIEAQGGNPRVVDDPAVLPQAPVVGVYQAARDGTVTVVEPRVLAEAVVELGGGRSRVEDDVDPAVGLVVTAKPGERVRAGQPLASVYARDDVGLRLGLRALAKAVQIGGPSDAGAFIPLVTHRVTQHGVETV